MWSMSRCHLIAKDDSELIIQSLFPFFLFQTCKGEFIPKTIMLSFPSALKCFFVQIITSLVPSESQIATQNITMGRVSFTILPGSRSVPFICISLMLRSCLDFATAFITI